MCVRASLLSAVVLLSAASGVPAQTAPGAQAQIRPGVTGRVIDAFSMAGIPGAAVAVVAAGNRDRAPVVTPISTDAEGRFEVLLPRGTVLLKVSAEGYLPDEVQVTVGDAPVMVEVLLLNRAQFKEEVTVTAEALPIAKPPATIEVTPYQVRSVAGAAENVFRVIQTLPGVNATADFDSRLAVRGGGPDQNLTIMDGVEIHNPYRLFGLASAFNPETVEDFEFTAGGFSPKYGDRLSSILLIENRAGSRARPFAGSFSAGLTDANVILEGKLPGGMAGSWLLTGRRTYYDLVASRFTDSKLPSFGDVQAKAAWELRPGRRLTVFALRSRETTDAEFNNSSNGTNFGLTDAARNDLVSASFSTTIGSIASSRTIASWYRFSDRLGASGNVRSETTRANAPGDDAFTRSDVTFTRDVVVRDAAIRQELAVRAGRAHVIDAGFDVHLIRTSWGWDISGDRNLSEANPSSTRGGASLPSLLDSRQDAARAGAWLVDRWQVTPQLLVEPGLRIDWSDVSRETTVSPRVSAGFALTPVLRARAAAGLFTQSPGYEKLLQSDYFVDLTSGTRLRNERSVHLLGALERDLGHGLTARVEGYYKSFDRLVVGRLETPAETAARAALYDFPASLASSVPASPQITSLPSNGASGRAYGFDVYLAHARNVVSDRFAGWASYTWGLAERDAYGRRYPFEYDRRHALSLVGTWRMSRLLDLAASARIASGFPYTPVVGLRVAAQPVTAVPGTVARYLPRTDASGLLVWTTDLGGVANLNTARLPFFARVDTRLTFRPSWGRNRWQFYLEVINLLNRKNAGSFDTTLEYDPSSDRPAITSEPSGSLPLLPSFGVRLRF